MDKNELLHIAENLYEEIFLANSYYSVVQQYRNLHDKYLDAFNVSPAFHRITYRALTEATVVKTAKIYDVDNKSHNISSLINSAIEYAECHREFSMVKNRKLSPEEECFYPKEVEATKFKCTSLGIPYEYTIANISDCDILKMYKKRLHSLIKVRNNLTQQRNKIFVHNDKITNFDYSELNKNNSINWSDIEALINFAFEFCQYYIALLTGVVKSKLAVNTNDLEKTLEIVQQDVITNNKS